MIFIAEGPELLIIYPYSYVTKINNENEVFYAAK